LKQSFTKGENDNEPENEFKLALINSLHTLDLLEEIGYLPFGGPVRIQVVHDDLSAADFLPTVAAEGVHVDDADGVALREGVHVSEVSVEKLKTLGSKRT